MMGQACSPAHHLSVVSRPNPKCPAERKDEGLVDRLKVPGAKKKVPGAKEQALVLSGAGRAGGAT
jgi:hypothetical protein